ncbi:nodulation-signaling pathway 2 protein-like [Ipomoea triloba]|uniref:nodulation-signaling pathway 2 protein-like n=1 Tax=Ipomoea triloba TaxID=35885 RepID=UPI00125E9694|nr:nodulation-signaling pathway 2 protein-like [Ipomoea triloba]
MMQPQLFHPSWLSYETNYSNSPCTGSLSFYEDVFVTDNGYVSPVITVDSSGLDSTLFHDDFPEFAYLPPLLEGDVSVDDIEDVCRWLNNEESEEGTNNTSSELTKDVLIPDFSVVSAEDYSMAVLPGNGVEMDDSHWCLLHLLAAYAEAMGDMQRELAKEIAGCIRRKANALGETLERVAYNVVQTSEDQGGSYLRREAIKNYETAFKVLYQVLPHGRFAHFSANSAILEAIPDGAEAVRIIDFDMGDGVQWPSLIESMAQTRRALRLTSVRREEESTSHHWRFEQTKRRLYDHAKPLGIKLQIEEMSIEELVNEAKRAKKTGKRRDWLAFNCMFRLPHMTNRQQRSQAIQFLEIAKEVSPYSAIQSGIVVFADGESGCWSSSFSDYSSFFNRQLVHYKSLFESMEWHFPVNLTEARIAVESLFLAPHACSDSWFHDWQENKMKAISDLRAEMGLQGRKLSIENILQAKEMVNERESPYRVRIEEANQHEMILEWRETPLVRVSTWM